jgi:FtsH-binding integral membrane protein
MNLRLLRLFLGFSAFAWGISVVGVLLSWSAAEQALQGLGARPIAYDPMLDYWLRMAAGAFALVGGLFLLLMIQPVKYRMIIPWFGRRAVPGQTDC